jgi:hypothetical protein
VGWRGLFYLINRITLNRLSVSINWSQINCKW